MFGCSQCFVEGGWVIREFAVSEAHQMLFITMIFKVRLSQGIAGLVEKESTRKEQ